MSGHLAGFAGRPVPVCESAGLEAPRHLLGPSWEGGDLYYGIKCGAVPCGTRAGGCVSDDVAPTIDELELSSS